MQELTAFSRSAAGALLIGCVALIAAASPAAATRSASQSQDLAAEVCEDMVRDAAIAAAGEPLAKPQEGAWSGRRYSCRYSYGDGELIVSVVMAKSARQARAVFASKQRSAGDELALYGIGQQGFNAGDGMIVARKDKFVLTVDPTGLSTRLNRDAIAWSTTRAIFDCW